MNIEKIEVEYLKTQKVKEAIKRTEFFLKENMKKFPWVEKVLVDDEFFHDFGIYYWFDTEDLQSDLRKGTTEFIKKNKDKLVSLSSNEVYNNLVSFSLLKEEEKRAFFHVSGRLREYEMSHDYKRENVDLNWSSRICYEDMIKMENNKFGARMYAYDYNSFFNSAKELISEGNVTCWNDIFETALGRLFFRFATDEGKVKRLDHSLVLNVKNSESKEVLKFENTLHSFSEDFLAKWNMLLQDYETFLFCNEWQEIYIETMLYRFGNEDIYKWYTRQVMQKESHFD